MLNACYDADYVLVGTVVNSGDASRDTGTRHTEIVIPEGM